MNKNVKIKEHLSIYGFLAPAMIVMIIFIVIPMFCSAGYSFTDWKGLGKFNYIGFDNYKQMFSEHAFWNSIILTFVWVIMSIVILSITSFVLAVLVEYGVGKIFTAPTRTILFMPMMMSMVSIGLLWSLIFNPSIGLLNSVLKSLGLVSETITLNILGDSNTAIFSAFIPAIWQWSGFGMVIISAAMQGISTEVMEASVIDGCTKLKQIRYIVFPLVKPTIGMLATLNLIGGFKCFDLLYVMTAGGPGISTQVTSIYIFKQAFVNNYYGYGSAVSTVLFIITALFGILFLKITQRMKQY